MNKKRTARSLTTALSSTRFLFFAAMAKKRGSRAAQPKPLVPSAMKSLKRARHVTSEFHRIQRELDVVAGDSRDGTPSARARADRQRLERQLDSLGGRQAYQEASVLTTARHRTCKWVFAVLTKLGMRPRKNQSPLRVLEIGAVNTQLLSVPWLDVRAIDIKSQHPRIEQVDFFDVPPNADKDVVVCAMVLNCVESASRRGRMLADAARHLKPGGYFFLMLPRRCVERSPFCTVPVLEQIMELLGMRVVEKKTSPKVFFACARRLEQEPNCAAVAERFPDPPREIRRRKERGGATEALTDQFAVAVAAEP